MSNTTLLNEPNKRFSTSSTGITSGRYQTPSNTEITAVIGSKKQRWDGQTERSAKTLHTTKIGLSRLC